MYKSFEQFIDMSDDSYINEKIKPITLGCELNLNRIEFEKIFNRLSNYNWPAVVSSYMFGHSAKDRNGIEFIAEKFGYTRIINTESKDGRWKRCNIKFNAYTLNPMLFNFEFIKNIKRIFFKIN